MNASVDDAFSALIAITPLEKGRKNI